jgi:hypothetical protein
MIATQPLTFEATVGSNPNLLPILAALAVAAVALYVVLKPKPSRAVPARVEYREAAPLLRAEPAAPVNPMKAAFQAMEDRAFDVFLDQGGKARAAGLAGQLGGLLNIIAPPAAAPPKAE